MVGTSSAVPGGSQGQGREKDLSRSCSSDSVQVGVGDDGRHTRNDSGYPVLGGAHGLSDRFVHL